MINRIKSMLVRKEFRRRFREKADKELCMAIDFAEKRLSDPKEGPDETAIVDKMKTARRYFEFSDISVRELAEFVVQFDKKACSVRDHSCLNAEIEHLEACFPGIQNYYRVSDLEEKSEKFIKAAEKRKALLLKKEANQAIVNVFTSASDAFMRLVLSK